MKKYSNSEWIEWVGQQENISIYKQLLEDGKMQGKEGENLNRSSTIVLKQAWLKQQISNGEKCRGCSTTENLTLDHVVPKEIILQFGIDEERTFMPDNYRVLCRRCNIIKSNKLDIYDPKTKAVLLALLEDI